MAGGQVVYLPQEQTFGSELGKGVSGQLSKYADYEMKRQQDQADIESNMRALNMMKQAGSREKALEVITSGVAKFKTAVELEHARKWVDEMYPPADLTPTKVTGYDKTSGEPVEAYTPKNQLGNNAAVLKALGPNATLQNPQMTDFYAPLGPQGDMVSMGRRPRADQSQGEYTKAEVDLQLKQEADRRAANVAERQVTAAERAANAAERSGRTETRQDAEHTMRWEHAYKDNLADMLNIKKTTGVDGSISLDFTGKSPEEIKQFKAALRDATTHRDAKRTPLEAATTAADKYKIAEDKPTPAVRRYPTDAELKKGTVTDVVSSVAQVAKDLVNRDGSKPAEKPASGSTKIRDMDLVEASKKLGYVPLRAPRDPKERKADKYYVTPSGLLNWTGTGWTE